MDFVLLGQTAEVAARDGVLSLADPTKLSPSVQIALFLGGLSFASAMLVSLTAFTRIIIVLSFVRRALSTQEIPPNPVILGLSLFLTLFVMAPTFEAINQNAIKPYLAAQETSATETDQNANFDIKDALGVTAIELKRFMIANTRVDDLELFFNLSATEIPSEKLDTPLKVAVPAFIVSELKTAFIMGFCIYLPFLMIDLVVSTVLMSLGMMMMPPVVVSTPCKILLFIMVDGWQLIAKALVSSFAAA